MEKITGRCSESTRKHTASKRPQDSTVSAEQLKRETVKRRKNVNAVSALGEKEQSERLLEELVFGTEDELVERLNEEHEDVRDSLLSDDSGDSETENEARFRVSSSRKAAWEDEEDEIEEGVQMTSRKHADIIKQDTEKIISKQKLQKRLKEQFQKVMGGTPSWAEKHLKKSKNKGETEADEEDRLLCNTGNFVAASASLTKGIIEMKNCLNANNDRPSSKDLSTVQFHPLAQVVMTAGLDQSISLFQVDGKSNPKIQSIFLERYPVYKARFSADGEQVVATSNYSKLFYMYDMMEGRVVPVPAIRGLDEKKLRNFEVSPNGMFLLFMGSSGYFHLVTTKTKELVCSMKINGQITGAAFTPDGSRIYTSSDEGEVFIWDVNSRKCLNRMTDDGSLKVTSIAMSKNGQYLACGSTSGVVNVYTTDSCMQQSSPTPVKAIMNLVTPVTSLCFNHNTEILAIASNIDEAVRLVHIPSFTVFSNYPVFRRKTVYVPQCMDFSPHSGFFSVANNKGHALLYRLKHYTDF